MKHNLIKFVLSALVIGLFLTFNQAIKAQSALDGFDPNPNATVRAVVVQPDGKILIGSDFTSILADALTKTGGNAAHNNMPPYFGINFLICISGEYPVHP